MQNTFLADIFESFRLVSGYLGWRDVVDVLFVAVVLYLAVLLLKRTNSFFIIDGIVLLFVAYVAARFLNFSLTSILLQYFFGFFIVIMVVIFREELRGFFESISVFGRIRRPGRRERQGRGAILDAIERTLDYLSVNKIGAIIVFRGSQPLDRLLEGGVSLNGEISAPLLTSIFDPTSPGHDGAVFIEGNRVKKFAAHLPLAEHYADLRDVGTRHRAAVGLSERSDAFVLVVSEERGTISLAQFGKLIPLASPAAASRRLTAFFEDLTLIRNVRAWKGFFTKNIPEKILVVLAASFLWFSFVFQPGHVTREYQVPVEFRFLANNIQVTKVTPTEVSVTLSGKSSDFELLDPKNLKVAIDASGFAIGAERVKIEEEMIQVSRNISVVDFSPATVRFTVEEKKQLENSPLIPGTEKKVQ